MPKDSIISLPDPRLRQASKKITTISSEVEAIIANMKAATLDWEASRSHEVGVALAAIQIGQPLRIVVIRTNSEDKSNHDFKVFVNPEITKYEGALAYDYEGCLSVPDVYGKVPRYEKVRVKALDDSGQEFRLKASGFLARVLQHEIDHTNGRIFIDLIKNKPESFFRLTTDGKLNPLNYQSDIANNPILWP